MDYAILIYRDEAETGVDWPKREADYLSYFKAASEAGIMRGGPRLHGCVGDVYKALADPTRRKILDELAGRDGQTLFEICSRLAANHQLGSSRQAISQHLDVLEAAGLIETRRDGRYKFHYISTEPLEHIADRWLSRARGRSHEDPPG